VKLLAALLLSATLLIGCGCVKRLDPVAEPARKAPAVAPAAAAVKSSSPALPYLGQGRGKKVVPILGLYGDVTDTLLSQTAVALMAAERMEAVAVVLEIHSDGGDVNSGVMIAKLVEKSRMPVYCVVDGDAVSMGYYILQSCAARSMTRRSRLMAHNPEWSGEVELNTGVSIQNWVDRLRVTSEALLWQLARRTRVSLDEWRRRLENEREWWMTAEEALKVGAVDSLVGSSQEVADALSR
jgi:ATP-dependent protease ClpP protease subunit